MADYDILEENVVQKVIKDNATINSSGSSGEIYIGGAHVIELVIKVGSITGTPSVQFHIDIIHPITGDTLKTYDGTVLNSAGATDYIFIGPSEFKGTYIKIRWDGTLDASNYFSGVFAQLILKR